MLSGQLIGVCVTESSLGCRLSTNNGFHLCGFEAPDYNVGLQKSEFVLAKCVFISSSIFIISPITDRTQLRKVTVERTSWNLRRQDLSSLHLPIFLSTHVWHSFA